MAKTTTFGNLKIGDKIHGIDDVWEILSLTPKGKASIVLTCKNTQSGKVLTDTKRKSTIVLVA